MEFKDQDYKWKPVRSLLQWFTLETMIGLSEQIDVDGFSMFFSSGDNRAFGWVNVANWGPERRE